MLLYSILSKNGLHLPPLQTPPRSTRAGLRSGAVQASPSVPRMRASAATAFKSKRDRKIAALRQKRAAAASPRPPPTRRARTAPVIPSDDSDEPSSTAGSGTSSDERRPAPHKRAAGASPRRPPARRARTVPASSNDDADDSGTSGDDGPEAVSLHMKRVPTNNELRGYERSPLLALLLFYLCAGMSLLANDVLCTSSLYVYVYSPGLVSHNAPLPTISEEPRMAEIWPTVDGVVDVPELARPLWDQIGDGVSMEDVGECINNYQGTMGHCMPLLACGTCGILCVCVCRYVHVIGCTAAFNILPKTPPDFD